ncbi:hypothetical protein O6H91_23G061800 [Diphasiastrum complanatum]|nr:hypothetical protein O6H91_23G061800 [Diphasiastrum complanatum]
MQRSTSLSHIIASSGQRPIKPPARVSATQINMPDVEQDMPEDLEKGEKLQWRIKAEQAVHLIPVVLLLCLLVLYICSSIPFKDSSLKEEAHEVAEDLHIQQATSKLRGDLLSTQRYTTVSRQLQYKLNEDQDRDILADGQNRMITSERRSLKGM